MPSAARELDSEEVRRRLAPVFAAEPVVASAYLFGSVARGEAGPESDVDIGIVFQASAASERDDVAAALAVAIGQCLAVEAVDVVDLEAQGPIFAHHVLCEGARIYEGDPERRIDFESDTIVRALDFRPTYDLAIRGKASSLRRWLRKRYDVRTGTVEARHPEGEPDEAR